MFDWMVGGYRDGGIDRDIDGVIDRDGDIDHDYESLEGGPAGASDTSTPDLDEVCRLIERSDALIRGENLQRLAVIDHLLEIERRGLFFMEGASSVSEWLVMRYRWNRFTARELVRVASALQELPSTRSAFEEGRLSWDQVRAIAEIADSGSDAHLAEAALGLTASEIRLLGRQAADPDEEAAARESRSLRFWFEDRRPVFRLELELPDSEGAIVATALRRAADARDLDPNTDAFLPADVALADAAVEMASRFLGNDSDPDRASILVHADVDALLSPESMSPARIVDGPVLSNETLRRLACDARIQLAITDPAVGVIGVGRASRTVPQWLARVIRVRDQGCRFPRCDRTRWVHIHHMVHWADGGPTDADNLITLCGFHHRLLHSDGWTISGDPEGDVVFIRPGGGEYIYRDDHIPGIEFHWLMRRTRGPVSPPDRPARWRP
jgi:hypothetical protein